MPLITCPECGKAFSDKASACPNCNCPIEFAKNKNSTVANTQKNRKSFEKKKEMLRDYLERIRILESDLYTFNKTIFRLRGMVKEFDQKVYIAEVPKPISPSYDATRYVVSYTAWDATKDLIDFRDGPIWQRIAWVVKHRKKYKNEYKRAVQQNEEMLRKYDRELRHYNNVALPEYERKVKAENERYSAHVKYVSCFNTGIEVQIGELEVQKKQTEEALQSLYNTDIIYPKYRGLIPVTMFCEYMDSKRRFELEGVNGMYDLYESELLGKYIVDQLGSINTTLSRIDSKLGNIASQLTGIERNQILLYEEVAQGNRISSEISRSTNAMLEKTASMASSTEDMKNEMTKLRSVSEMTAYNTQVAGRRLEAMEKIKNYEYSLLK